MVLLLIFDMSLSSLHIYSRLRVIVNHLVPESQFTIERQFTIVDGAIVSHELYFAFPPAAHPPLSESGRGAGWKKAWMEL